jgi:hypothetical protein
MMAAADVMILPVIERLAPCGAHARLFAGGMERCPYSGALLDMSESDSLLSWFYSVPRSEFSPG